MSASQYDVVVVGAGCAGLTAAIGLARGGFTVAVVESAPMAGASNGLGGVCFAENLAEPDVLGIEGVEALAWERRLIERGSFVTDGRRLLGSTYRDPGAFVPCYTVLQPVFDAHLAQIARMHGVALLTATTVESLIRADRRVIGVATTRGPLYGDLVFLAEGDAGHLVSHEGFDRSTDPRDAPAFLYCLEQVIELPPGAIEETFGVSAEQGVAHDLLLRNRGQAALNVRGFVCTNRQSLTVRVALPAGHLARDFDGEPRRLLDWFVDMPALRPWWREGRRGLWTARVLRTGGLRDIPYLVEDGLAIGGAAAGLGVDFPVLNTTGPATATGLLLSRAAARIRAEGGGFGREQLQRHYLEPLQQSRYWKDREFLQRWPGYLRRTSVRFGQELDLLLDSAAVWTRPRRWLGRRLLRWFGVLGRVRWSEWSELQKDWFDLGHTLRLREVTARPALGRVLLDGTLNAFRDLARQPRPHLPPGGELRVHFHSSEEDGSGSTSPVFLRGWFGRFRPVLASAGHILYHNDDTELSVKFAHMVKLLVQQINLLDLLAVAALAALAIPASLMAAGLGSLFRCLSRPRAESAEAVARPLDRHDEARPPPPPARPEPGPEIHIVLRSTQPRQRAEAVRALPRICPSGVFEVRGGPPETVDVIVQGEKCIECEACWRTNPAVDWGRGRFGRVASPVRSPVLRRLLEAEDRAGLARPASPRCVDPWITCATAETPSPRLSRLLVQLAHKLREFDDALVNGPALLDRGGSDHLEMLARYAQQLGLCIRDEISQGAEPAAAAARHLADALATKLEERTRRTWDGRFAWAAADGRQLRQHHLAGLHHLLGDGAHEERESFPRAPRVAGSGAPLEDAALKHLVSDIAARRHLLETLERLPRAEELPARAELLAALAEEVHAGLTARIAEWKSLLGEQQAPLASEEHAATEIYRRHGPRLLADAEWTRVLLDLPGDWPTLIQRRALAAERREIEEAEDRLAALATDWREASREAADVSAGFARQAALVLAGKWLLLDSHARLEAGRDAQLALVLLRVWLDYAATQLDAFALVVHERLHPPILLADRPLVEPGAGPPLRTQADYLAAVTSYTTGDFLLAPVDLLQARLTPEMLGGDALATLLPPADSSAPGTGKPPAAATRREATAQLLHLFHPVRDRSRDAARLDEAVYAAEALAVETIGRCLHSQTRSLDLELAAARLILTELCQQEGALGERCVILQALAGEVMPRWLRGGIDSRVRHLGREVLELEALKGDVRRRLMAAWEVFGEALGRNANVQASCFALAEATAWLKAADSVLGRMAWTSRLQQAEDREEPATRLEVGRRALAHGHAQVRDRLRRFEEDLAALRRGYYAPHVRAAALLARPEAELPPLPAASDISMSLRVLVVVEPRPVLLPSADGGERVLESHWTLGEADRAALEHAIRLRDAAPYDVTIDVAALGPPRVGQALREVLNLGIERVRLVIQEREGVTAERASAMLAAAFEPSGPFDLILGGSAGPHREKRLAALVAGALGVLLMGHATELGVCATPARRCVRLSSAASATPRERPLPAAVLIDPGAALRPFTVRGYLDGLHRSVEIVPE
jgi:flavin-dependent dehydrogenase